MKITYKSNHNDVCICWLDSQGNETLINLAKCSGVNISLVLTMNLGVGSMWAPIEVFTKFIENAKLLGYEFEMYPQEGSV